MVCVLCTDVITVFGRAATITWLETLVEEHLGPDCIDSSGQTLEARLKWLESSSQTLFATRRKEKNMRLKVRVFGSLQTSIQCIVGEIAVEGLWLWLLVLVTGDR